MKTELWYQALVTAFTGLLRIPYILDRVMVRGMMDAVGYVRYRVDLPGGDRLAAADALT